MNNNKKKTTETRNKPVHTNKKPVVAREEEHGGDKHNRWTLRSTDFQLLKKISCSDKYSIENIVNIFKTVYDDRE